MEPILPSDSAAAPASDSRCFTIATPNLTTWIGDDNNRLVKFVWNLFSPRDAIDPLASDPLASDPLASDPLASDPLASLTPDSIWPLVLTGQTGVGKSLLAQHLIQRLLPPTVSYSVASRQSGSVTQVAGVPLATGVPASSPPGELFATTGNDFSRSYQQAVAINALLDWRTRCETATVMVVDHLLPLVDDLPAQNQLSDLLDSRCDQQLPTIIVSSELPSRCGLTDRLASRLSSGMLCPVSRPGDAAMSELITRFFSKAGIPIDSTQRLSLVAAGLHDVAVLQQICHRWVLEQGYRPFSFDNISQDIKQLLGSRFGPIVKPELVLKATAKYFQLSLRDLRGASRASACSRARALAMWICRQYLKISYQQIGRLFGDRDHTTVISSCKKIDALLMHDPFLQTALQQLLFRLTLH